MTPSAAVPAGSMTRRCGISAQSSMTYSDMAHLTRAWSLQGFSRARSALRRAARKRRGAQCRKGRRRGRSKGRCSFLRSLRERERFPVRGRRTGILAARTSRHSRAPTARLLPPAGKRTLPCPLAPTERTTVRRTTARTRPLIPPVISSCLVTPIHTRTQDQLTRKQKNFREFSHSLTRHRQLDHAHSKRADNSREPKTHTPRKPGPATQRRKTNTPKDNKNLRGSPEKEK